MENRRLFIGMPVFAWRNAVSRTWLGICKSRSGREITARKLPSWSTRPAQKPNHIMSIGTILLIILILALVGALPTWGHSQSWGYAPSGGLGLILLILVILLVLGKI